MARIRSIKPEFFSSPVVGQLTPLARLTWIATWVHADDEGRHDDHTALIRAQAFPFDAAVTVDDVEEHMKQLDQLGLIQRYEVDGRRYFVITNFAEHQHPNRPTGSKRPAPPLPSDSAASASLTEGSVSAHEQHTNNSPLEGRGKEGLGREGRGASDDAPPPKSLDLPAGIQQAGAIKFEPPSGDSPYCPTHPTGTDRACFACKLAREEYEIRQPSKVMRRARAVMENFASEGSETDQRAITA